MIQFDSRPGALEELFVTDTINTAGAYTVKFYVQGMPAYVTVDDWIPVTGTGSDAKPVYASSMHEGEIWPMIMEKAWAKLVGSYEAIEGGSNWWTMTQMTNDPVERVMFRDFESNDLGYTSENEKGLALWEKLKFWNAKEYMMFTGTDKKSYIKNHAFTLLQAVELDMAGTPTKMLQLRNPWKGDDGWTGDYSKAKGGVHWDNLGTALAAVGGIKEEAGKFWMSYKDFL